MIDSEPRTKPSSFPAGMRQALLTTWVGASQLSQVEWVPDYIQPKAQVLVGQDDKVWIVEEIY